ncbi:phage major capsid protein [Sphaerisporangium rhizosphaerae]|uniref:Phage major capsid protein n=1 Tax=Sphaerisporangium rhizosphaerae TaxID=2269375 RepID=A0ABW2NX93_9ACTN
MTVQELKARLGEIEAERRSIDIAAGDSALSEDAQTRWDDLDTEEADVRSQVEEAERRERVAESRSKWQSVQIGTKVSASDRTDVARMTHREASDHARSIVADERASDLDTKQRAHLDRLLQTRNDNVDGGDLARRLLVTETPEYRSAFMKLATRPNAVLNPEESRAISQYEEYRALSVGTGSAGGYGVPVMIDPTIILTGQGSPNHFFDLARVETITTNQWKGVSSAGVSWSFKAEAAPATDNSPTLAQPTVPTYRADGYIPYSYEVEQDYPGFAAEMSRLLASGYSELLVDKLTNGSGTNEPTGIITALNGTGSAMATATAGTLTASDVNKVWAALPIKYRNANAAWMSHTDVNNIVQQLGASNNASAFTVNFTDEGVTVLKGRKAYVNDYFDAMPSGTTAGDLLVVGDWTNYLIAQRAGMSIELVPHLFDTTNNRPTGQRAWFACARVGADSINDASFRLLQNKTS